MCLCACLCASVCACACFSQVHRNLLCCSLVCPLTGLSPRCPLLMWQQQQEDQEDKPQTEPITGWFFALARAARLLPSVKAHKRPGEFRGSKVLHWAQAALQRRRERKPRVAGVTGNPQIDTWNHKVRRPPSPGARAAWAASGLPGASACSLQLLSSKTEGSANSATRTIGSSSSRKLVFR